MAVENMLSFTVENVINCVHNERIIWDPAVNGSEEQKELAWHRGYTRGSGTGRVGFLATGRVRVRVKFLATGTGRVENFCTRSPLVCDQPRTNQPTNH